MNKKGLIRIEARYNIKENSLEIEGKITELMKNMASDSNTLDLLTEKLEEIDKILSDYLEEVNEKLGEDN